MKWGRKTISGLRDKTATGDDDLPEDVLRLLEDNDVTADQQRM